jgi:hypothetical protein
LLLLPGEEALCSTSAVQERASRCFQWLDEPLHDLALQSTSTAMMSSPYRCFQSGFSIKCTATGAIQTIRLRDFVELVSTEVLGQFHYIKYEVLFYHVLPIYALTA